MRDEAIYSKVFNTRWDLGVYLASLEIVRSVEMALVSRRTKANLLTPPIRLVHFIAYSLVCLRLGKTKYQPDEIVPIAENLPTESEVHDLRSKMKAFARRSGEDCRSEHGINLNAAFVERFLNHTLGHGEADNKMLDRSRADGPRKL